MDLDFEDSDLDRMIIKDKAYYRKKRNKILIIVSIILLIGIVAFITTFLLLKYRGGKIICVYITTEENENIKLINANESYIFSLTIDDKSYSQKNNHTFEKAGTHNIIYHFKDKLESLDHLFYYIDNLIEIDFSQLETENIKSFAYVLNVCRNLTKVNFDNKTPNLIDMEYMFSGSINIQILNIKLNTSNVKSMFRMFQYVEKLASLDISNFEFDNLINAECMFEYCENLRIIKFNEKTRTFNLKIMDSMFNGCTSLEYINTEIFKFNKLLNFYQVFRDCYSLKEIDISNFDLSNALTFDELFNGCKNLESLNFSNIKINPSLQSVDGMFSDCFKLTSIDLSHFNFSSIKGTNYMFNNCVSLKHVKLPNKMVSLAYTNYMFNNCYSITSLNLGFLENAQKWSFAYEMFKNCKKLEKIEIPSVTTFILRGVQEMFNGCTGLKVIDFGQLETKVIYNITKMFYHCEKLEYLDLSKFNTKGVKFLDGVLEGVPRYVDIRINKSITSKEFLMEIEKLKNETIL